MYPKHTNPRLLPEFTTPVSRSQLCDDVEARVEPEDALDLLSRLSELVNQSLLQMDGRVRGRTREVVEEDIPRKKRRKRDQGQKALLESNENLRVYSPHNSPKAPSDLATSISPSFLQN